MKWCIVMVALIVAAWLALRCWHRYLVLLWLAEHAANKAKMQEAIRARSAERLRAAAVHAAVEDYMGMYGDAANAKRPGPA